MAAYYNEIDPYAAQWLRNLIDAGHIARGDVDERSIADVRADDLRGYTQCHFFAGIGGWSVALRLAGWPDDRPVWTGSCPCQPFSAVGKGQAADDDRHLWPAWFSLIRECKPAIVFGEQVEAAIGWGWLDLVSSDLEGEGYAVGAAVLPACGVGAPHIRNRLWFVSKRMDDATGARHESARFGQPEQSERRRGMSGVGCETRLMADADGGNASPARLQRGGEHGLGTQDGGTDLLVNATGEQVGIPGRARLAGSAAGELDHAASEGLPERAGIALHERDSRRLIERSGDAGELGDAASGGFGKLGDAPQPGRGGHADGASVLEQLGDADRERSQGRTLSDSSIPEGWEIPERSAGLPSGVLNGFWRDAEWIACTDGKARPTQPGLFPLGHGIQRRASKLRAYGNAIVPQVAAEFIAAFSLTSGSGK